MADIAAVRRAVEAHDRFMRAEGVLFAARGEFTKATDALHEAWDALSAEDRAELQASYDHEDRSTTS